MERIFYSGEALFAQRLEDFVDFGRKGVDTHTLFSTYPTDTNDGPIEEIFAAQSKLQPFKGLKKTVGKDAMKCEDTF